MLKYDKATFYMFKIIIISLIIYFSHAPFVAAKNKNTLAPLEFSCFKLGQGDPVVLVIGGIQGDEPGGFSAASLLATQYTIHSGAVWVVPNLNFHSIIKRSRGIYGDMNRKFASLDISDPEYDIVSRIQELIRTPEVKLVLNLHDGSGFFRPKHENNLYSPRRWGQSVIIDQEHINNKTPLAHLGDIAEKIANHTNLYLLLSQHKYHVRNTNTAKGDKEMEKSLSWYAVRHGKAAFGLEASKEFTTNTRTYYHLLLLEGFLNEAGIKYTRNFELTVQGVSKALKRNLSISFANNKIVLPLDDIRPQIRYLPLPRDKNISAIGSNPLLAVLPSSNGFNVHYGNRTLTRIHPDWLKLDNDINGAMVAIDNEMRKVFFCQIIDVKKNFMVMPIKGYRINAIGVDSKRKDESNMTIHLHDFIKRFSVDRKGTLFRVEIYKEKDFAGMFLVRFVK